MNGRELESGGHHYPKDFRRELTPECYREIEGMRHPTRRAPPHPRRIRAWSLKSEYSSGAPAGRNLAAWLQDFAIAMSCEDYRTNPILAVTYFTSLIESVS